jgi:hypothetical protein
MIHTKAIEFWEEECRDILSTIKESEKRVSKPLTEGKTLSNIKDMSKAGLRPSGPPGQRTPKAKKCRHLNIRFTGMGPDYCPDCNINVLSSSMVNVLLDLLHVHPHSEMPIPHISEV